MSLLHTIRRRWRALVAGRTLDRELDEELRSHLDMEIEHNLRRGMSPDAARTAALRSFGGLARTRDDARDSRGVRPLEELGRDIRVAARSLRHTPAFTAVAVLTLALGIGVSTAVFSLVDGVLLRPLPYPEPDRLVRLYERDASHDRIPVAGANALDIQSAARALQSVAYFNSGTMTVLGGERAERVRTAMVSPSFFGVLGVTSARGRLPDSSEAGGTGYPDPGAVPSAAVVSHRFWQSSLGGDDIAGRTLRIEDAVVSVVGILPPDFDFPADVDVWIPTVDANPHRTAHNWAVIGRLAPGATIAQARAELDPLMQRLKAELGREMDAEGVNIVSLHDDMSRTARPLLVILMGAVGFVLLVACVNLASANLARGEGRRRELAVRAALGAGRGHLARLVLAEQVVVAAAGGALGLALAAALIRMLVAVGGAAVPVHSRVGIDGRVLLFTATVTALATLLVGTAPAIQAGRDLRGAMSGGDDRPDARGGGARRLRGLLVGVEVALALTLLVGAGLLVKSMRTLVAQDPGFRTDGVLTATVSLPSSEYPDSVRVLGYFDGMLSTLAVLPGVTAVGVMNAVPISGRGSNTSFAADGGSEMVGSADYRVVGGEAFRVLDIPLLAGRGFGPADVSGAPHAALVNEAFARRYWPDGAIGHRVRPPGMDRHGEEWLTIVGVVGDVRGDALDRAPYPTIYVTLAQRPENLAYEAAFVVSSTRPTAAMTAAVRDRFHEADANVPVRLRALEEVVYQSLAARRFTMLVLGAFAGLALFLAAVGIYGVLAYSVARRQREIGLRMALGAREGTVRAMVFRDAMRAVIPGVMAGLAGALALTRLLRGMLYEVSATDPAIFALVALILLSVAALASWIPARRATRVSPMVALRSD